MADNTQQPAKEEVLPTTLDHPKPAPQNHTGRPDLFLGIDYVSQTGTPLDQSHGDVDSSCTNEWAWI